MEGPPRARAALTVARVVVVGAGVGGLAAALRLQAMGHRVVVCDAADRVGGKLGRATADGFTWDTGPSLVTMPQVFAGLFSDVGERMDEHLDLVPVEPIARYRWRDGTVLDTSADAAAMAATFTQALGPGAAAAWTRLMEGGRAMWEAVEEPILRAPVTGWRTLARLAPRLRDLTRVAPHRTLRQLGLSQLPDPRQRMMLDRYATYTGSDPRLAPAVLLTVAYAELAFGGWYVRGGLYRLATALAGLAVERGAEVRVRSRVTSVHCRGGGVQAVRLASGEAIDADVVVADVDARQLYEHVVTDAVAAPARRRARRAPSSLSGFVVLLGVRGATTGLAHHNVWFPTDYDAEFDALFGPSPAPVADPTIYVSVPRDATQAPAGDESWFVLVNAPRHGDQVDWDAPGRPEAYARRLLELLAARGFDVRDRVVVQQVRSPADLERATGAPGGAIYGSSSNGPVAAFLRAANTSAVRGLYLVGGSAHPGGGLPLVVLSAATVAELVGPA
jgi:phytoene desaturase